jgi:type IV pilus assembly protein PilO
MNFNDMSPLAKIGAILLLAVLAAGAFFYFEIKPLQDDNDQKRVALKQVRQENDQLRAYQPRLAEMERNIASLQQQMEIQKQIVPDDKAADDFIRMMQRTASEANVVLRRFESRPIEKKEYYTEEPFLMEVDGPYYAVLNFFDRVTKLERIVNVEKMKMAALKSKNAKNPELLAYEYGSGETIGVSCVAKTYFRNSDGAANASTVKK